MVSSHDLVLPVDNEQSVELRIYSLFFGIHDFSIYSLCHVNL